MILNSPYVSGSLTVTGNITALGGISISGSIASASYASNAELLDGLDSSVFVLSSSFQNYSSSNDGKVAALNTFSASILSYTSSTDDKIAQLNRETASLNLATASLYNATASLYAATASLYNFSSSANLRIGSLEQYTQSLNTRSASFACVTATNNFACTQYFSNTSNAVSFTSTGSLYSDGGMRITKDMYVSGTAFFNNVTVFGTQSINYISSSQLNIASNIISVNTATPTVRFGGLAVYDSGSLGTGLTGSILWDSEDNQWIYSNPSGSTYDSAVFLVGPRNSGVLGNEPGISCNFLSKGNGLHHMTSSGIFEDGSRTCFYGNASITSAGAACFASSVTSLVSNISADGAGVVLQGYVDNTLRIAARGSGYNDGARGNLLAKEGSFDGKLTVSQASTDFVAEFTNTANSTPYGLRVKDAGTPANNYPLLSVTNNAGSVEYFRVNSGTGISTFSGTVCSPSLDIMPSGIGVNTLGGIMRVVTAGTSTGIAVGQSNANRYTHIAANDIQVFNDDFFLSTRCAFPLSIGTCYTARLTFAATGIACFACQVCIGTSSTVTGGGLLKLGVATGNAGAALQFLGWSPASGFKSWQIDTAYIGGDVLSFTPSTTGGGTTFTNPVLSIGSSGISCFSSTVCAKQYSATFAADGDNIATFINSASSYLYGAGGVFIGSSTAHNCTNLAGGSGALIIRNGASTYTAAIAYNGTAYFCGNVGIGISPSYKLDVCSGDAQTVRFARYCAGTGNTNGQIAEFVNLAAAGYSSYIYIGSSPGTDWKIGKNVTNCNANYDFTIVDSSNFGRMRITPTGEVCFACQVCAASFISSGTVTANQGVITNISGLNVGGYNHYTQTVSGAMGILGHNVRANGSIANQVNVVNSGWISSMIKQYYNEGITFHTSTTMYNAGDIFPMDTTQRLRIGSDGISCFSSTVCAPLFTTTNGVVVVGAGPSSTEIFTATGPGSSNGMYLVIYSQQGTAGSATGMAYLNIWNNTSVDVFNIFCQSLSNVTNSGTSIRIQALSGNGGFTAVYSVIRLR